MNPACAPIIHPTDFSSLKISVTAKCKLYVAYQSARMRTNGRLLPKFGKP